MISFNVKNIAQLFIFLFVLLLFSLLIIGGQYYFRSQNLDTSSEYLESKTNSELNEKELTVCGWIPWWDFERGKSEFTENKNVFNSTSPLVFVLDKNGNIVPKIENLKEKINELKLNSLTITPSIYNEFDGERVSVIINSPELSKKHIDEIVNIVTDLDVDGVELDYEYLLASDKNAYSEFVKALSKKLHDKNLTLSVTLHPKISGESVWDGADAQDWFELGKYVDYLIVMAYDYHWGSSDAEPIAPLPWFKKVIEFAKSQIPNEKIVVGIGMYGYDWENDKEEGKPLTLSEVDNLLEKQKIGIQYSKEHSSPFAKYILNEKSHTVWFENELSVESKLESIKQLGISDICIWRIGGMPAHFYDLLKNGI